MSGWKGILLEGLDAEGEAGLKHWDMVCNFGWEGHEGDPAEGWVGGQEPQSPWAHPTGAPGKQCMGAPREARGRISPHAGASLRPEGGGEEGREPQSRGMWCSHQLQG